MPIKLIKGDLFSTKCDIIAHGVNGQGVMGSGVAKIVKEKYPQAYLDYTTKHRKSGWFLGQVQLVHVGENPRFIANCCTQQDYGRDVDQRYVSYDAVLQCLDGLLNFAEREGYSVAMPKIGAGLANGDWNIIFAIIRSLSFKYDSVAIEVYEL